MVNVVATAVFVAKFAGLFAEVDVAGSEKNFAEPKYVVPNSGAEPHYAGELPVVAGKKVNKLSKNS